MSWREDWRRDCGEIREAGQSGARDDEMVVVERPPVVKACEVGRKMD